MSFAEAITVFDDPLARIFADEGHSGDEEREIMAGHSAEARLLLVYASQRWRRIACASSVPASYKE